jgi:superfamily II DNA/RNA helicase
MTQSQRTRSLERFDRGRADTLVATDVAARGLDVDSITHVVNFDPPHDATAYTHRVGRTGRAGRDGIGITLVMPDERADVTGMADTLALSEAIDEAGLRPAAPPPRRNGGKRGGRRPYAGGQHRAPGRSRSAA